MRNDPAIAIILSILFGFTVVFGGIFGWLSVLDHPINTYLEPTVGIVFTVCGISFLLSVLVTLIFKKND